MSPDPQNRVCPNSSCARAVPAISTSPMTALATLRVARRTLGMGIVPVFGNLAEAAAATRRIPRDVGAGGATRAGAAAIPGAALDIGALGATCARDGRAT